MTTLGEVLAYAKGNPQSAPSLMTTFASVLDKAATTLQAQQSAAAASSASSASRSGSPASALGGGGQSGAGSTAGLQVNVLKATQALDTAQQNLAGATLKAPISGTVGSVGIIPGRVASTSSAIVIVGPGAAVVTVDLPLAQLGKVRAAQPVTVTPAGTTEELAGLVASISVLPTSSTSSTPTYPATITVSDAPVTLASGSVASATITLATASHVLTVPVSAVSGVSNGAGTVGVLKNGSVADTRVTVGAVGQGLAQVDSGLTAGQVVVLADPSLALPSATTLGNRLGGVGGLTGGGGRFVRGG